ncbi:hypothetical protein CAC42_5663 [Sphaceloma murrayae]|uniref:37S ribosomal protein S35, mitochondrial n=1 Tax=Sphaceloma murrayae TaxID=2082308 RepID=A0A2K1QZ63_9PEZI|nr:hypothetical protein CAC42_5663 [Sphaceloma murrayae]
MHHSHNPSRDHAINQQCTFDNTTSTNSTMATLPCQCRHILRQTVPLRAAAASSPLHPTTSFSSSSSSSLASIPTTTHRAFSSSPSHQDDAPARVRQKKIPTRLRRRMYAWFNGPGRNFREPLPGSTNYMGAYTQEGKLKRVDAAGRGQDEDMEDEQQGEDRDDGLGDGGEKKAKNELPPERTGDLRPYPLNENFMSQSVLSDEMKELVFQKVVEKGESVSAVSVELGIDMRRIGAVVRLLTVERNWVAEGKPLATAYASAVMSMLPQTPAAGGRPHETINDLPVHPATQQQIFYPTSESRHFTREDAAQVFSPTLLPADKRIPHPELIESARPKHGDLKPQQRTQIAENFRKAMEKEKQEKEQKRKEWEKRNVQVVERPKWNFRFESIRADQVGRDGRDSRGVGWRYGMPHEDRKRGFLKDIPLKVVT